MRLSTRGNSIDNMVLMHIPSSDNMELIIFYLGVMEC